MARGGDGVFLAVAAALAAGAYLLLKPKLSAEQSQGITGGSAMAGGGVTGSPNQVVTDSQYVIQHYQDLIPF